MSRLIEIGAGRLPDSGGDLLIILNEPDDGPATVLIHWPSKPSVIDPAQFRDTAAAMVKLFGDAHVTLTRIRARKHR